MHCVTLNNIRILFFCYASRTNLSVIPNEHQSMPGVNGPPTKITMLNPHDSELEGVLFLLYFSVVCPSWSFLWRRTTNNEPTGAQGLTRIAGNIAPNISRNIFLAPK